MNELFDSLVEPLAIRMTATLNGPHKSFEVGFKVQMQSAKCESKTRLHRVQIQSETNVDFLNRAL